MALALTQCKVFLYFVTPRSVDSSNCVKEVNFCLSRERKILPVHLEATVLPVGLELSLSDMQAIIRSDHSQPAYRTKLADSLRSLLPSVLEPVAIPIKGPPRDTESDEKSTAILPLVNRSDDPANEYLCDGISEELITGLSKVKGLRVASQLASFRYKNRDSHLREMGSELAVETILSGSVQKVGNRVRVTVRLDEVKSESNLWSEKYEGTLDDMFDLQDDVARQVIEALRVEFSADTKEPLIDVGTKNTSAYDIFLTGLHQRGKVTRRDLEHAIDLFQQAIQLDPGFGRASWEMISCYTQLMNLFGVPREELGPKAEEAANRAREGGFIPPMPWIAVFRNIDLETRPDQKQLAMEACEKIRNPDPEWRSFAYRQLGLCMAAAGLFNGAVKFLETYLTTADDGYAQNALGNVLACLGRFDRAIDVCSERIASEPDSTIAVGERALLYSRTGQYEQAEKDLEILAKVLPRNFPQFYQLYWRREVDAAKAYFAWLEKRKNLPPIYKYWGCFLLGDIDRGIEHMEEAYRRGTATFSLRVNLHRVLPQSISKQVEEHPGYQAILARFGLDITWKDELMRMVNQLTEVTNIRVQFDEDY